jgi:hypothetical protein
MATLQRGNLEQFTESIALCGLSKTFQDAVQTAQRLGLQYIWIGSLCIIQDDNDDWQRESSTMSKVYAGSTLNIAAAAAEDGRIVCFFQRNQRTIQRIRPCVVQVPSQGAQDAMYAFQNPFHWLKEVDQSPLAKRAWVLQERFLAPRTLYFGASHVYWECSRLVACESFPFGMENTVAGNQSFTFNAARANCFEDREDQEQDETYWNELSAFWHTIVRSYSRARLTKEGDKLVAISGIARFCQSRTGDQYVAGLWKNHLHAHLLWSIKRWVEPSGVSAVTTAKENIAAVTTAKKYIAPSWSWASANRAVKFHGLEGRSMISVLDIHLEPLGHDPLGQLKAASLRIQCSLLRAPVLPLTRGTDDFHSVISVVHDYRFKFDADLPDNMNHVYMMMVEHSTRYSYQRTLRGLLISATGNQQGQYRRVGYFELQHLLKATVTMFEVVNGLPGLETEEAYEAIADPDKHGNQYVIMLV